MFSQKKMSKYSIEWLLANQQKQARNLQVKQKKMQTRRRKTLKRAKSP